MAASASSTAVYCSSSARMRAVALPAGYCGKSHQVAQRSQRAAVLVEAGLDGGPLHLRPQQLRADRSRARTRQRSRVGSGCSCTSASAALSRVRLRPRLRGRAARCILNPLDAGERGGDGAGRHRPASARPAPASRRCRSAAQSGGSFHPADAGAARRRGTAASTRLPPRGKPCAVFGCVRGKFVAAAIPVAYKERLGRVHIGLILAVMPAVEDKFDSSGEGQRSADGANAGLLRKHRKSRRLPQKVRRPARPE